MGNRRRFKFLAIQRQIGCIRDELSIDVLLYNIFKIPSLNMLYSLKKAGCLEEFEISRSRPFGILYIFFFNDGNPKQHFSAVAVNFAVTLFDILSVVVIVQGNTFECIVLPVIHFPMKVRLAFHIQKKENV